MMDASQKPNAAGDIVERRGVEDGTAFWTMSFYISRAQIEKSDLALQVFKEDFKSDEHPDGDGDAFDLFDISRFFVDHPDPTARERHEKGPPGDGGPFRARERLKAVPADDNTRNLRGAVNPLFNDIADRSRLGRIEDELFATKLPKKLFFVLPREVEWSTEGRTYKVPTCDPAAPDSCPPRYPIRVSRFWYLHGNGALSWHVSFEVRYRDAAFADALKHGRVPNGLYLLSLMQKLAYPKEREIDPKDPVFRSDEMFELRIADGEGDEGKLFWDGLGKWFNDDAELIEKLYNIDKKELSFDKLCPVTAINEIPGLFCHDTRSNFFLQDKQFFELIQPKKNGELVERRTRVRDAEFKHYPKLVDPEDAAAAVTGGGGSEPVVLGPDYWTAMYREPASLDKPPEIDAPTRLLYLFLAGFNQNIIDWTNQEASEVLDSLDPIYPQSDEQLEEGFFIRYANPRCLISYVQRSRTLEVGNDFIGTCPYAFLIHVLALHNERLTRDQEKLAFAVVEKVNSFVKAAQQLQQSEERGIGDLVTRAETWINWYRMAAFELFDRHRYSNPFRYDTERDVFDELEKLRGTSRLQEALDKAFAALEESARDLERVRAEAERERERHDDRVRLDKQKAEEAAEKAEESKKLKQQQIAETAEKERERKLADRDRKLTGLFGIIGLSGVGQLAFNIHQHVGRGDMLLAIVAWAVVILILAGPVWYFWHSIRTWPLVRSLPGIKALPTESQEEKNGEKNAIASAIE